MTIRDAWDAPLLVDDRELWALKPGTKVREIDGPRRDLIVGLSPQWLWHRDHPVPIGDVEMPVEVVGD